MSLVTLTGCGIVFEKDIQISANILTVAIVLTLQILADPGLGLHIGNTVQLNLNTDKAQFFDPTTERSLLWA